MPAPDMLPVLLGLLVVVVVARLGGSAAEAYGQPAVLGELAAGILIGNLGFTGFHALDGVRDLPAVQVLAQVGVLFLLFEVGLETDLPRMAAVGASSLRVAALGVVAPMLLGLAASRAFFPGHHPLSHWFVGATLCATSVGITARVLKDLGRADSVEGRIILGAAVIDDLIGLLVLAVVGGLISAADHGRAFDPMSLGLILGKSLLFLVLALGLGRWLSPRVFGLATRLRGDQLLLPIALAFCFGFAWLAGRAGLAPIVGAFLAGLVLEEVHYRDLVARDPRRRDLRQLFEPLTTFLAPLFFVLVGMRVDLSGFGSGAVLGFAAVLTLAAVLGKQACALGVMERGADRAAVGLGMIPRGEVGLIFASIGATLRIAGERVVDDRVFSAVVFMVAVTTLLTPPLLAWRMGGVAKPAARARGRSGGES